MRVLATRLFLAALLLCLSSSVIAGCVKAAPLPDTAAAPVIRALTPSSGGRGTTVKITGSGFKTSQGSSTVSFNGVPAAVSRWGKTSIEAVVPDVGTTGPVIVTVDAQPSNSMIFSVSDFTLSVTPTRRAMMPGDTATYTVTLIPVNGFNTAVALSVSANLPAGTSATFTPNPVVAPYTSTLTMQTNTATPPGLSNPMILGQGGLQAHTGNATLCLVGTASVDASFDTRVMAARAADFDITPGSTGSGTAVADGSTREIANIALVPGTYTLRLPRGGGAEAVLLPFEVDCACNLVLP